MVNIANDQKRIQFGSVYTPEQLASWVASEALSCVVANAPVVACDPACGDGELLMALKSQVPTIRGIGMDIDADAIKLAAKRCGRLIRFVQNNSVIPSTNVSLETSWKKTLGTIRPNLFIMNPPWGIDFKEFRQTLEALGYSLANGQFDSFEIFCEAVIQIAKQGAVFAFILPDSIFSSEKNNFRRHLLKSCKLHLVARLGEGFFDGVFRSTAVIIAEKGLATDEHEVNCLRLTPINRDNLFKGKSEFKDIKKDQSHRVKQSRFLADRENRFDLDLRTKEESTISKFQVHEPMWSDWLKSARGVEISKTGRVVICPSCKQANPYPRSKITVSCSFCSQAYDINPKNVRSIIFSQADRPANTRRIIVGEDVDRYLIKKSRFIAENVPGIDYKPQLSGISPRILVRKTGLGIKAALDLSGDYTNQVVFMYYQGDKTVPDFFLYYVLGVLCSRVTLSYFLRTHGETEWKSHPYVTQRILNSIPIPTFAQGSQTEKQARAIADAVKFFCKKNTKKLESDIFIDCLVAGLYGLSSKECQWVVNVLNEAQSMEPIRTLRLDAYELLLPHHVI